MLEGLFRSTALGLMVPYMLIDYPNFIFNLFRGALVKNIAIYT